MTLMVEKVLEKIQSLPDSAQDEWAARALLELESDAAWESSLTRPESRAFIQEMLVEMEEERKAGLLRDLDPNEIGS
jgi:hypothetical protein